jgi:hypothetical protein
MGIEASKIKYTRRDDPPLYRRDDSARLGLWCASSSKIGIWNLNLFSPFGLLQNYFAVIRTSS